MPIFYSLDYFLAATLVEGRTNLYILYLGFDKNYAFRDASTAHARTHVQGVDRIQLLSLVKKIIRDGKKKKKTKILFVRLCIV